VVIIANKWKQLLVQRQFLSAPLMTDQRQLNHPFFGNGRESGTDFPKLLKLKADEVLAKDTMLLAPRTPLLTTTARHVA
jgi:hypothetical protein